MKLLTVIITIPPSPSNPEAKTTIKWLFVRTLKDQVALVKSLNKDFKTMPCNQQLIAKDGHTVEVDANAVLDANLQRCTKGIPPHKGVVYYMRKDGEMPLNFDF